jgi:hypothetical protein
MRYLDFIQDDISAPPALNVAEFHEIQRQGAELAGARSRQG